MNKNGVHGRLLNQLVTSATWRPMKSLRPHRVHLGGGNGYKNPSQARLDRGNVTLGAKNGPTLLGVAFLRNTTHRLNKHVCYMEQTRRFARPHLPPPRFMCRADLEFRESWFNDSIPAPTARECQNSTHRYIYRHPCDYALVGCRSNNRVCGSLNYFTMGNHAMDSRLAKGIACDGSIA